MFLRIEFGLVLVVLLLAFLHPQLGFDWFGRIERNFGRLAQRKRLSALLVGVAALGARAAVLPILPVTDPTVHDEFSYLLAADTFAHGRLTNPPHPMWIHFETFHVFWHPRYASMYPPAQGLVLAAGQVIAGHPFWGMWLGVGLMCAAICWMLQGWLSPEWALLGGALAVVRYGIFSYWANSYWGGAVGAIGGALVLGAFPRIVRFERTSDALLMGLGLTILANSRPYEGLIFSLPIGIALFVWLFKKKGPSFWTAIRRVVVPLSLVVLVAALATTYYFWRVTGSPFRFPQQVDRDNYASAPYFLWQSPRPQPIFNHEVIRDFYIGWELPKYEETRTAAGLIKNESEKIVKCGFFFLGPALALPLLAGIGSTRYGLTWASLSSSTRFLLIVLGVSVAGLAVEVYFSLHYASPMIGLILALVLLAIRQLRIWTWRGRPVGLFLTRASVLICLTVPVVRVASAVLHVPFNGERLETCCSSGPGNWFRAGIESELESNGKQNLVIVRYGANHNVVNEWVYNKAEIDRSPVVWARDMGAEKNKELLEYFKDREVWLVEPDENPPKLSPYPTPLGSTASAIQVPLGHLGADH